MWAVLIPLMKLHVTKLATYLPNPAKHRILPRSRISTVLRYIDNYKVRHARLRYSSLIHSNLEWKAQTAFSVRNTEAVNIPETVLTGPWHRTHVYVHVDRSVGPKSMTSKLIT